MNRVISFLQSIRLRQSLTVLMVGITLFVSQAFLYSVPAQAQTLTPEAKSYQVENEYAGKNILDTVKEKVEDAAENVVEKLNLNEPVPESTKEFFGADEDKANDTVKSTHQ
jgi:hypothetical protein